MTVFTEAQHKLAGYDNDLTLGNLCWYSIPEGGFSYGEVIKALQDNGLNSLFSPPEPRPRDIFKRCCTSAQRKRVAAPGQTFHYNYMIREVGKDADNIWRRVVRERVDANNHSLGYQEMAELHYNSGIIESTIFNLAVNDINVKQIVAEVVAGYEIWSDLLTAYAIREMTRKLLEKLDATVVRPSGGVYFVGKENTTLLHGLETVLNGIGDASFHTLPLLDDGKQREMLRKAFEDESVDEVDQMIGEINEILQSGKQITANRFGDFSENYQRLTSKCAQYSDLLDEAMDLTATRLEIAQMMVGKLALIVK